MSRKFCVKFTEKEKSWRIEFTERKQGIVKQGYCVGSRSQLTYV